MYKIAFITLIFSVAGIESFSVNIEGLPATKETASQFYNKALEFYGKDMDSVFYYADIVEEISEKAHYKRGLINAAYLKGDVLFERKYYDQAARELYKVLNLLRDNHESKLNETKVKTYQLLGLAYEKTYNYTSAINLYHSALEEAHTIKDTSSIAYLNFNIGITNFKSEKYDVAKKYLNKSLIHFRNLNDFYGISRVYNTFGLIEKHQNNWSDAINYYQMALSASEKETSLFNENIWYVSNIGECFYEQNKFDSALFYYTKAHDLSIKLSDKEKEIWILSNIGDTHQKEGNYAMAVSYYEKSIALSETDIYDKEYARATRQISLAYEKLGQYQKALQFKDEFIAQTESLEETNEQLFEDIAQFKMREMEWNLEIQNQNEQIYLARRANFWFMVTMSLLAIIIGFSSYKALRYYRGVRDVKRWLATDEI